MAKQRLELTWYNKDKALIPVEDGRYGYSWVHPADPRYCETRVLAYDNYVTGRQTPKDDAMSYSERADLEPQTDNLLIRGESGDVLEALTRVPELAERYVGKVKLVYIDPPFNTAQTFASYEDNLEHSIWLTMMRDRLLNLKRLLSSDGSIWVHLDDVEVHRMRLLMDEVFGAGNFLAQIVWVNGVHVRNDSQTFSSNNDIIIVYAKENATVNKLPPTAEMLSRFSSPDGDPRPWQSVASAAPGGASHQGMVYGIQHPITGEFLYPPIGRHWVYGQEGMLAAMNGWVPYSLVDLNDAEKRAEICGVAASEVRPDVNGLALDIPLDEARRLATEVHEHSVWPEFFFTGSDGCGGLRKKGYVPDDYGRVPQTTWSDTGRNDEAKREVQALFPGRTPFSTPKPERLLERIIHIGTDPGDIVLDCFAGSGTTAAVAQKMGRRWVTCELLDSTFNTFTLPRLEKVVNDEDPGGITCGKGGRIAADDVELPDGVSPEDAQKFTSVLNKLVSCDDALKKSPQVKVLKALAKTAKAKDTINWRGGGGFQVAHLAPACYDFDPELGRVFLTPAATGELLIESVAANLGFTLYMDDYGWPFDAYRGRAQLKVHEGVADVRLVDELVSQLEDGQTLVLAATAVADGTREHLRRAARGSRIILIPDDLFPYAIRHPERREESRPCPSVILSEGSGEAATEVEGSRPSPQGDSSVALLPQNDGNGTAQDDNREKGGAQ